MASHLSTTSQSNMRLNPSLVVWFLISMPLVCGQEQQEATLFSGPQPGENLPPIETVLVYGDHAGTTVDLTQLSKQRPTMLVLVNGSNRPAARLSRILMNYAELQGGKLFAAIVYLNSDRWAAMRQLQQAVSWWKVAGPVGVSVDGVEGPGSYGLNRNVNVTVLIAKEQRVVANFALVQPSETDAPKILRHVAQLVGGRAPNASELTWLSFPTAKPAEAKFRAATTDTRLRQLICNLLATEDAESAAAAARAIDTYVDNHDQRGADLKNAANLMLEGRARPMTRQIVAHRYLARWAKQ